MKNLYSTNTTGGAPTRTWTAPPLLTRGWLVALLVAMLLPWGGTAFGQTAAQYTFSTTSGVAQATFTSLGTIVAANVDDNASAVTTIPFTFNYAGTSYTQFSANANGIVRLGSTSVGTVYSNAIAGLAGPFLLPLWDDLYTGSVATTGGVTWGVNGTAPNRKVIINWRTTVPRASGGATNGIFQVQLEETTNKIYYVYGAIGVNSTNSGSSIGITSATGVFSSVTLNATSTSSTASTVTGNNANTIAITAGTQFTYTPPACTGTPTAGTVSPAAITACATGSPGATLVATGATGIGYTGITYQWESALDDGFGNPSGFSAISGATAGSYTTPTYTGTITYFRLKVNCSASGLFAYSSNVRFGPGTPATQTTAVTTSAIGITTAAITVTAGSGTARVIKINTANSFTDMTAGDDPAAATAYAGGEQVVYNGVGTTVTVTNLTAGTTYYIRSYEAACSGLSRVYNVASSATNPNPAGFTTKFGLSYDIQRTVGGGYSSIVGTSGAVALALTTGDDNVSTSVALPFSFKLQNQTVLGFTASTNGVVSLSSISASFTGSSTYTNYLGSTGLAYAMLAPFWDDLYTGQNIVYKVLGSSPDRSLVIEWKDAYNFGNTAPKFNFQVILHEGTVGSNASLANAIEYNYGQMQAYSFSPVTDKAFSYSIGITGFSVTSTGSPVNAAPDEILAQQYENTEAFSYLGAGTADNGANRLRKPIECGSNITFRPGTYAGYSNPSLAAPTNDNPASAITLNAETSVPTNLCGSGGISYNYSSRKATTTTATGVTAIGSFTGALAGANPDDDVWFKFVANSPATDILVVGSGGYWPVFEIYSDDGSGGYTKLSGGQAIATGTGFKASLSTPSTGAGSLSFGTTYYVRVFNKGGGTTATGTATTDNNGTITSVAFGSGGAGYYYSGPDYPRVEITGTGKGAWVTSSTSGSSTSPAAITGFSLISGGVGYAANTSFPLTVDAPGWGTSGDFAIVINASLTALPNDACNQATQLSVPLTNTAEVVNQYTAASTASTPVDCGAVTNLQDVWYMFQATFQGATVVVTPSGGFDPKVEVFETNTTTTLAAARAACGTFTSLGICQSTAGTDAVETVAVTSLTPGNWYAVRVYNASGGSQPTGSFRIGAFATDVYAPSVRNVSYTAGTCPTAAAHTVTLTLIDGSGVNNTTAPPAIKYTVNGGAVQTILLTKTAGTFFNGTWSGTIPAQGSGQVVFQIFAQDNATTPNSATVDAGSYQDAYLSVDAGPDKGANVNSTTILAVQNSEIGTVRITEFVTSQYSTGIQSTWPGYVIGRSGTVELTNESNLVAADLSNYSLVYDNPSYGVTGTITFPANTIVPPRGIVVAYFGPGTDSPSDLYFNSGNFSYDYPVSSDNFGFYLKSGSGKVTDAVAANSYTFPVATNVGTQWSGAGVNVTSTSSAGGALKGADANTNANWSAATVALPTTIGTINTSLPIVEPPTVTWTGGNLAGATTGYSITTPVFASANTYTFTATLSDGSCTAVDQIVVTAVPPVPPVAAFIATPTTGTIGGVVTTFQLTDQSTNTPDTWAWSFSGPGSVTYVTGSTATSQNPKVKFTAGGTYSVTLTVTNNAGGNTNTLTKTNYITVGLAYCTPTVSSPTVDEDLGRIAIGAWANGQGTQELGNPAATGGYTDLTAQPGPSIQRTNPTSVGMWVISANASSYYATSVNLYIDYNHNGVFEQGELAFYGNVPASGGYGGVAGQRKVTGTLTVPYAALDGPTRMRAIAWESGTVGNLDPCGAATWGEFEDYNVTITAPPACTTPPVAGTLSSSTPTGCGTGTAAVWQGTLAGSSNNHLWQYENTANPGVWNTIAGITGNTGSVQANATGTYNFRVVSTAIGCADAISNTVSFVVNVQPAAPTAVTVSPTTASSCAAPTTVTLTGTPATGTTLRWYTVATGGTVLTTGSGVTTPLTNTTTLYAESYNSTTGCTSASRTSATFTNSATVTAAGATPALRCGPGTVDINATNGTNGTTLRWYTVATGGSVVGTGSPFTTPNISTTQTYYVESYNPTSQCVSPARTAVTATVDNNIPGIAATSGGSVCGTGVVTLNVTNGAYQSVQWYDAPTGGTLLAETQSFTTPTISSPTTYYATLVKQRTGSVGIVSKSASAGTFFYDYTTTFSTTRNTTLYGVYVYPGSVGIVSVKVMNSASTTLATYSFTATAGQVGTKVYVPLNVALPIGTGYNITRMDAGAYGTLYYEPTVSYPINGGSLNITASTGYEFYDWKYLEVGCPSTSRTATVANVKVNGTWQGSTSAWSTPTNWCGNAVPTATSDVVIQTGGSIVIPVISSGSAAKNVQLDPGATLTINSTLDVKGNIASNSGTINGSGTLTLSGTATQTLSGTVSLPNTVVANAANVASGARVSMNPGAVLTINAPLTVDVAGNLVLRSTPAGTASIGPVSNVANFSGQQITMERHLINAGWHFVGAPIKNVDFTQWSESGQRNVPLNNSTLFRYTEGDVTRGIYSGDTTERDGWKIVKDFTDQINPSNNVTGYRAYFRPSFMTTGSHAGYIDTKGVPFVGPASSTYGFTTTNVTYKGYNLLSNPYPSAISWTAVVASNGGAGGTHGGSVYLWNAASSNYGQYTSGPSGTNGTSDVIPSSQAFFIHSTAAGTMNYVESHKVSASGSFLRTGSDDAFFKVTATDASNTAHSDEAMMWFNSDATTGFDAGKDAVEMTGPFVNISFMPATSLNLAIDCRPEPTLRTVVPMSFTTSGTGTFTIGSMNIETLPAGTHVFLHDIFMDVYHDLSAGNYTATVTSNPLSQGETRFELAYEPSNVTGVRSGTIAQLSAFPNPATGGDVQVGVSGMNGSKAALSLVDNLGRVIYTATLSLDKGKATEKLHTSNLAAGIYTINVMSEGSNLRQQLIVK